MRNRIKGTKVCSCTQLTWTRTEHGQRRFQLEIEDEVYTAVEIAKMTLKQLHALVGQCETERQLRFVQQCTNNEVIHVYIDNLIMKL